MTEMIYVLQFRGKAAPTNAAGTILKARTTAPSCTIATTIGPDGASASIRTADGAKATFESEVTITGETSFQENGTITFGEGRHRLHFSTVGEGYLAGSADPKRKHGAVTWKVDRGEGQFEGATGLITSNFFVSDDGGVIDNHFGVIFLK